MMAAIAAGLLGRPRLILALASVVSAVIAFSAVYLQGRGDGRRSASIAFEEQDARAASAVAAAKRTVDECYDAGRGWDVTSGRCR